MYNNQISIYILFSFLFVFNLSVSQENKLGEFKNYEQKAQKLNIPYSKYLFENNIDLSNYQKLKSLGVDLKEMITRGHKTYKEASLFTDVIVTGTVVKREYQEDQNSHFLTTIFVEVKDVLKNANSREISKTIPIKLQSGKMGEKFILVSHEPRFFLGEEIILYLTDSKGSRFNRMIERSKSTQPDLKQKMNENISMEKSGYDIYYLPTKKYKIKQNLVFDSTQKIENINDFKKSVKEIIKIN